MKINYNNQIIDVIYDVDVAVIGGGTAGVSAAISAVKNGLNVVVVEKTLGLAGSMSMGMVNPMMCSYVFKGEIVSEFKGAIFKKEEKDFHLDTAFFHNPETVKEVSQELIVDKGGKILYDAQVIDTIIENSEIKYVIVMSFNNLCAIKAKNFIDATGDAKLARLTSIPVKSGDESGKNQSFSFRFELGGIDYKSLKAFCKTEGYTFSDPSEDNEIFEFVHVPGVQVCGGLLDIFNKAVEDGELTQADIRYIQGFSVPNKVGCMSFNGPQLPNEFTANDPIGLSFYVEEGRKMQRRLWRFLKQNIPGFQKSFISQEANLLGIRESFRIVGKYELTESDYINRRKFEDGVCMGDWYIDIHNDDLEVESDEFKQKYSKGEGYDIPYRALVTNEIDNYIAVGRHISASFKMQSSIRIQYTCMDMGEVAGKACVISIKKNIPLNKVNGKDVRL